MHLKMTWRILFCEILQKMSQYAGEIRFIIVTYYCLYYFIFNSLCFRNLLGKIGSMLSFVVSNRSGHFINARLRETAVLALSKFMCVSSLFCSENIRLLFTVLERAPESNIRANIVIALGDLGVRFPNLIEPWTANIYKRLSDKVMIYFYLTT